MTEKVKDIGSGDKIVDLASRRASKASRASGPGRTSRARDTTIRGDRGAVYFDRGSAVPKGDCLPLLRQHARRLLDRPSAVLQIRGYSNRRRSVDDATRLAQSRVAVISLLLRAMGVPAKQLEATVGGIYRVTEATTRESRAENRRAELRGPFVEIGAALSATQKPRQRRRASGAL